MRNEFAMLARTGRRAVETDLALDRRKVRVIAHALDQVVVAAQELDAARGLLREHADLLVALLPARASAHHRHDDVLRGHERQLCVRSFLREHLVRTFPEPGRSLARVCAPTTYLLADVTLNHLGVDHKALANVLENDEDNVRGQERLRQGDASVRTVVQRALEPLGGRSLLRVPDQAHQVPTERTDPLASGAIHEQTRHSMRRQVRGMHPE